MNKQKTGSPHHTLELTLPRQHGLLRFVPTPAGSSLPLPALPRSEPSGKLPPVLAIVVYNGKAPWNAARSLEDLIEPLPGDWEPLLSYRLVDEQSFPVAELAATPGPVATLFQLELGQDFEDIRRGAAKLVQELPGPQYQSLREAFAVWIQTVVVPAVAPGSLIPELGKLLETAPMLEQSVLEWRRGWQEEGRVVGRLEGRQEVLLARQLERKFGPLPTAARARLESADADQLLEWGERVLSADTLAEVFDAES